MHLLSRQLTHVMSSSSSVLCSRLVSVSVSFTPTCPDLPRPDDVIVSGDDDE